MRDVADTVVRWLNEGRAVALARVMSMEGFGGRRSGEAWACTEGLAPVGAVAMGAADAVVAGAAHRLLADHSLGALSISVPVGDAEAVAAGLACGGAAHVVVQLAQSVPVVVWELVGRRVPVAVATNLTSGAVLAVTTDASVHGTLGPGPADAAAVLAGVEMLKRGRTLTQSVELADGTEVFIEAQLPQSHLVVLGEAQLATALVAQGRLLGWSAEVFAEADTAQAVTRTNGLGPVDAVVVLSHDIAASCAVLAASLEGGCGYSGALGSRHTQTARAEHLRDKLGVKDDLVRAVHGPVGLDLGSRTPAETALAIFAEIVAHRSGRNATSLKVGSGPING